MICKIVAIQAVALVRPRTNCVEGTKTPHQRLEHAATAGQTQLAVTHATELVEEMQKLMRVLAE